MFAEERFNARGQTPRIDVTCTPGLSRLPVRPEPVTLLFSDGEKRLRVSMTQAEARSLGAALVRYGQDGQEQGG